MAIDGRRSVGPDDTRPAGREVIADRRHTHTTVQEAADAVGIQGRKSCTYKAVLPAAIETERSVVTTQISDVSRAQRRVRSVAPVSDRAGVTMVEPVPRIALMQQEACDSLGCSEEFFVEHIRPYLRVVRRGRKRRFPVAELRRAVDETGTCSTNRGSGPETLYPDAKSQRRFETERGLVTTQIGEHLDRAQHRVIATTPNGLQFLPRVGDRRRGKR